MKFENVHPKPYDNFGEACKDVLAHLQNSYPFGTWMMTRTIQDDWIVIESNDRAYGIKNGEVFRWSDSFCRRMVAGEGPNEAPDVKKMAVYNNAPIAAKLKIGSYIGYPVYRGSGELYGTLCAIDPVAKPEHKSHELEEIKVLVRLLSTILDRELIVNELRRAQPQHARKA